MSKDLTQYVTTAKASSLFGVHQDHIRKLINSGKVKGIKFGHDWLVYLPSLERYNNSKSPGGRPRSGIAQSETVD